MSEQLDAGPFSRDVAQNHRVAADLIRDQHRKHGLTVVVGGGNDHTYSQLVGLSEALPGKKIGCINIDPHFDVRKPAPSITSGSPFYLALESGILKPERFIEFGIQRHCNGPELWDYIEAKKVHVMMFEEMRFGKSGAALQAALDRLSAQCDEIVVSLDLDAIDSAHAPGVSAPQAEGFSPSDILEMMAIAGTHPKVPSLGIYELNPAHDIAEQTSRMAATAAYHFIAHALARKPAAQG